MIPFPSKVSKPLKVDEKCKREREREGGMKISI